MDSDDAVVRVFEESDQEAVAALYLSARNIYENIPVAGACYAWFVDDKLKPDGDMQNISRCFIADQSKSNFWVATHQGKVVGCVGATPTTKYTDDHAELVRMYVSPECRGKGVGSRLIAALENWAKLVGYKKIYLSTLAQLSAPNYVYPKSGFLLAETEDYDVSDRQDFPAGTTVAVNHYVKEIK